MARHPVFSQPARATGERFLMREPQRDQLFADDDRRASSFHAHHNWKILRETILRCGGEVETLPPTQWRVAGQRSAMYVRDTGFFIAAGGKSFCILPQGNSLHIRSEADAVAQALRAEGIPSLPMKGAADGGNLVYNPASNVLYWGVNNRHHLRELEAKGDSFHPFWRAEKHKPRAEKLNRIAHMRADAQGLGVASDVLDGRPELAAQEKPFRIQPMFTTDAHASEFYHLDGALGVLPSGQMVACTEVLGRAARRTLEASGADIYPVSLEEAREGATNFITVGQHVITPHASPGLKRFFARHGYETIDPPAAGLEEGSWQFGPMAGPRCATLKTTPDLGFPAPRRGYVRS